LPNPAIEAMAPAANAAAATMALNEVDKGKPGQVYRAAVGAHVLDSSSATRVT
jgi:hypothetical protein